jgi:hypothetical protein
MNQEDKNSDPLCGIESRFNRECKPKISFAELRVFLMNCRSKKRNLGRSIFSLFLLFSFLLFLYR